MESVDSQLFRFEMNMREELEFQLTAHTPYGYWEEVDELNIDTSRNIKATLHDLFSSWIVMYQGTPVASILTQCRDVLYFVVWSSMNVPYPHDPILHIKRVVANAYSVYIEMTYTQLRTEMLKLNHHAHLIQRNWRHIIANPRYNVCKRRLAQEFKTLTDNSSM